MAGPLLLAAHSWTWPLPEPLPDLAGGPWVWLVRAEPSAALESPLSPDERRRATALRRPLARSGYVAAHTALRRLLGAYLGVPAARVPLTRLPCPRCGAPHGRPVLAGPPGTGLHFSLSRTGASAMLAVADTPVGVDLERIVAPGIAADAARSLHPADRAELAAAPPPSRPAAFTRCWTRTEALAKATGTGLSSGTPPRPGSAGSLRLGTRVPPAQPPGWRLTDVTAPPGHAAACAVRA